jgi:oligoendopeptidase F
MYRICITIRAWYLYLNFCQKDISVQDKKMKNSLTKFEHLKKINISNQAEFKILLDDLLSREITSKEDLLEFQQRRDDIEKAWVTEACESYLLMSRDVTDLDAKNRHNHFDEVIQPLYREYTNKLNQKFLKSEFKDQLGEKYTLLVRNVKNDQELFAKENLPLLEKIDKISSEITEISAKLVVEWDGEEKTISDVDAFLESPDRNLRKKAYESVLNVEVSVSDQLDEKFEQLVSLRHQVALQSGFSSYTQYRFKQMRRFDWSPKECFAFHQAVKKHIVPLRRELWERRKAKLGIEELTPYDLSVSEDGEEAFHIYKKGEIATLIEGTGKIVKSIDSELYKYFCQLKEHDL